MKINSMVSQRKTIVPFTTVATFAMLVFTAALGLTQAHASDAVVNLDGSGSQSGEPLSATIEIDITDNNTFVISITNTSPATSSTEAGAPVITRLAFDTLNDGTSMTLQSESYVWSYTDKTKPFCGKKDRTLYPHGLSAVRPAPHNGIAPGDTAIMTININGLEDDLSAADFENFSWAMKFQVVGADGEDSGCAFGDAEVVTNPDPAVVYKLSEFVASGGEKWPGLKSNLKDPDTRIGSLEINTYGGVGTGNDPPYKASIVTLRNGTGAKIEQKMVERGYTPAGLDADGCNPAQTDFIECFIWADDKDIGNNTILPGAYDGFTLTADVPDLAFNSNDGFDTAVGSTRITVSGNLSSDNVGVVSDNSHQTITATWEVPEGRNLKDTAQMLFRGRYDWECNGLDQSDAFVALFYHNYARLTDNVMSDSVTIVEDTATRLTIKINVQDALNEVRDAYVASGVQLNACQ